MAPPENSAFIEKIIATSSPRASRHSQYIEEGCRKSKSPVGPSHQQVVMSADASPSVVRKRFLKVSTYKDLHNDLVIPHLVLAEARTLEQQSRPSCGLVGAALLEEAHMPAQLICLTLAVFITHAISTRMPQASAPVGVNIAQALVTVLAAAVAPKLLAPIAAGAYSGMLSAISVAAVGSAAYAWLVLLSACHCVVWAVTTRFQVASGYPGRLGTTAFTANLCMVLVAAAVGAVPWRIFYDETAYATLSAERYVVVQVAIMIGCLLTVATRRWASNPLSNHAHHRGQTPPPTAIHTIVTACEPGGGPP